MAGLIKTILCLKHRAIPATLHFTSPNPELHLDRGPFVVRSEYGPWEWDGTPARGSQLVRCGWHQRACRLGRGTGGFGTSPSRPVRRCCCCRLEPPRRCNSHALPWPPNCPAQTTSSLPDVAYTLARRRKENIRMAAVVHDRQDAAAVLAASEHDNVFVGESVQSNRI